VSARRLLGARGVGGPGFTLIETVVATALLGIIASTVLWALLFGMSQSHSSLNRSAATAWAQAELDFLRLQGYANLTVPTTRTLTATTGYTSFGNLSEPTIPAGLDHAVVSIQAVAGVSVDQLIVTLYQSPSSVYATYSTYLSNYTHP
jgi:prepilin-type N-terminal cleavage/methylation domain-containing protein